MPLLLVMGPNFKTNINLISTEIYSGKGCFITGKIFLVAGDIFILENET